MDPTERQGGIRSWCDACRPLAHDCADCVRLILRLRMLRVALDQASSGLEGKRDWITKEYERKEERKQLDGKVGVECKEICDNEKEREKFKEGL